MPTDPAKVIEAARREIQEEAFREAVAAEKNRIKAGRWWHRLIPFTITINWRSK